MESKDIVTFEESIRLAQEQDAIFEEWAAGGNEGIQKQDDDELDLLKLSEVPFRKKKGNPKSSTIATCEICGIILKHPSRIKEHMRTHTGEKPFECDICGMRFTQRTPMINHFRVQHMDDLPYVCSFGCGKRFVNNSRKNAHELRHIGLKRTGPPRPHLKPLKKLVCPPLDTDPPRSENLSNAAVANFIPPPPTLVPEFQDPETEPSTSSAPPRASKMSEDSSQRIDEVISSVLARVLAPQAEEVEMEKVEETLPLRRPYVSNRAATVAQCTICGLMLKHPSKIAEHIRTHTGEKPFECGECGMCLSKATSLKVHIRRMHTSERPFPCEWGCGMWFVTESVKREHVMAVHAGVKRYTCVVKGCNAFFTRRNYLMRHRKNVHGSAFCHVFEHAQVANEEAADPELDQKTLYVADGDEERVLLLADFDEEEFVEQEMAAK